MSEAKKHDKGKPRLDLIPPEAMIALGEVLRFGAQKYGDRNWEQGARLEPGRLQAAALRHLNSHEMGRINGDDYPVDDESGMPHLWHAICCVAMLIATIERNAREIV